MSIALMVKGGFTSVIGPTAGVTQYLPELTIKLPYTAAVNPPIVMLPSGDTVVTTGVCATAFRVYLTVSNIPATRPDSLMLPLLFPQNVGFVPVKVGVGKDGAVIVMLADDLQPIPNGNIVKV